MNFLRKLLPLIGISLFIYLVFKIGLKNIVLSLSKANLYYMIAAFLFIIPIVFFQALKWYVIIKKQNICLSFFEAIKIQFICLFYGFVTPARIGTFIKINYLQKITHNFGKSASSVVIERLFDMIAVLIFATLGSLVFIENIAKGLFSNIAIWMLSLLIFFVIFSFFLVSKNVGKKTFKFLYEKLLPNNLKEKTRHGFDSFYDSIPKKRFLLLPFLLTIITWFLIYTPNFFIAKSLNINIPYLTFILLLAIATIIAELPITISGLGVREAALITMLKFFNVEPSRVMSLSILSIMTLTAIPALIGFFISFKKEV